MRLEENDRSPNKHWGGGGLEEEVKTGFGLPENGYHLL